VDYLALYSVMMDMRLKLVEDAAEAQREQVATAYRNLEAVFDYLRRLQEAVNGKGSAAALSALDRMLRSLGREMCALGVGPIGGKEAGILFNTKIGSIDFWGPFLLSGGSSPGAMGDMAGQRFDSPPRTATSSPSRRSGGGLDRPMTARSNNERSRPTTATAKLAPLPMGSPASPTGYVLSASPQPPQNFWAEKRDLKGEQERMLHALASADAQLQAAGSPTHVRNLLVTGAPGNSAVMVKVRPQTAKGDRS